MQVDYKKGPILYLAVVTALVACLLLVPSHRGAAWSGTPTTSIPVNTQATEFSRFAGSGQNVSEVVMAAPSTPWNVDNIGVNLSSIVLGKEDRLIVDGSPSYGEMIKNGANGWAVEIDLDEPVILYGVYVLVRQQGSPPAMNVSLFGYNGARDCPNATAYGSTQALNVNTTSSWQYQSFGGLPLEAGQYFLGIYGENFQTGVPKIWWHRTTSSGNLHVSRYTENGGWEDGTQDAPFSYRLVVQPTKTYRPSELAMRLEVAGKNYSVGDGSPAGTGSVSIPKPAITTNGTAMTMQVHTNRTAVAYFNYSCGIILSRSMSIPGYLNATQDEENNWLFLPSFTRTGSDYHVEANISARWHDVRVFKTGVDITGEILLVGQILLIPNATITAGVTWLITARSAAIPFSINLPKTSFEPNQTLSLTATPPVMLGQFSFVLYNALGVEEYRETRSHNGSGSESFNRVIGANAHEGNACIVVVWKNETDAGIQARFFTIKLAEAFNPGGMDLALFGAIIAGVVSGGFATTMASYKVVHRSRRKAEAERLGVIDKLRDLFNLDYLIVLDKKSSVDLYEASFGDFKMDTTLVSGFLSAIKTFGQEMTQIDETRVTRLEYDKYKIVMSEYEDFRIAMILKAAPSSIMIASIDQLAREIREKYGSLLKTFNGETTDFQGIKDLVEKNLHVSILSPLRIGLADPAILSTAGLDLLSRAKELLRGKKNDCFLAKDLFASRNFDSKAVLALYSLVDGKYFVPVPTG